MTDTQPDLTERARPVAVEFFKHWISASSNPSDHINAFAAALVAFAQSEREAAAAEARRAAYDDAKQAALNPFLCEEDDGPLDLQRKIGKAIDFRKKLALASPVP